MSIHIAFNNMKKSEAVTEHVQDLMKEMVKITDNKYPFHVNLTQMNDDKHHVVINCNYSGKALSSNATHVNLYKAIGKSVDAIKTQVIRKAQKLRHEG